jgi:NADH-quinone oxidoreductase subunit L
MVEEPFAVLRWIPGLPLFAALVHGVLLGVARRPLPRVATVALSCGAPILAFALSFFALVELTGLPVGERVLVDHLYTWIGAGDFVAEMGLMLDPLSAVMILVVTGVGSLIHVYSVAYMEEDHREDRGFERFFCYLNLFTFAMLMLVLGDGLLVMFLGWEGVGLCSYLLIGFWYADDWNAAAGAKAFIVNRIGDFGFLVGTLLLFWSLFDATAQAGLEGGVSLSFNRIQAAFPLIAEQTVMLPAWLHWLPGAPVWGLPTLIGLCFFLGAVGKSAQIPLYVWLPDAMAGPTPVSALIHAATMVTAGVYLVCRLSFLYAAAPGASAVIAWTGAVTALFAAIVALAQTDIKKILAYSTISQLGYMFLAAGVGATSAAMFHVTTHAFFKALLFLGAGAVILAVHHEQDTDRMGGLSKLIPLTSWCFALGVMALIGVPFFSGFFSKDEILLAASLAHDVPGTTWLYGIGLATAGLSAFYMCRLYFRTFSGEYRGTAAVRTQIEEPGWWILGPLFVLAALSVFGGWLGPSAALNPFPVDSAHSNSFANFLAPVLGPVHHDVSSGHERRLAVTATAVAGAGAGLAYLLYVRRPGIPAWLRERFPSLHRLVEGRFFIDELVDRVIVQPVVQISDRILYRGIDAGFIDGAWVHGSAAAVRAFAGDVIRYLQSGLTQGYLFVMILGTVAILGWLVMG